MLNKLWKTGSDLFSKISKTAKKHQPEILAGLGIAGFITTTGLACKATAQSVKKVDKIEKESNCTLSTKDKIKVCYKYYIPTALTGIASSGLIIGSVSTSLRRTAVFATAYKIAEDSAREYKDKVIETIGEKKEKQIREEVLKDKVEKNPPVENQVIVTGKGQALCYETKTGRYFYFDIDRIHKIENELNATLRNSPDGISLNEVLMALSMDPVDLGYEIGWSTEFCTSFGFTLASKLTKDEWPCIVIGYETEPRPGYSLTYSDDAKW